MVSVQQANLGADLHEVTELLKRVRIAQRDARERAIRLEGQMAELRARLGRALVADVLGLDAKGEESTDEARRHLAEASRMVEETPILLQALEATERTLQDDEGRILAKIKVAGSSPTRYANIAG